ncbi:MAG: tetraacyldisaccharide 4'-kinase [Chlorobium sp.]|uniref:tetraacyldisaccharide 4'-kinase n=1 Tax=Chlorobium sp. TaxID=1095 RepID=UPI0025BFF9B3|nr:tetraacyldisaccharide 4'-kinase [Chlorobium sp.]MCF8383985.1 tetraacyldisaccharide 4'-kinase [Chlorobium sp.]
MSDTLDFLRKPAALLYREVIRLRNLAFECGFLKTWHAPLPVISIGNITAGGTGKTPLADWIIGYYRSIGQTPALLSRGYGRSTKGVVMVADGRRILCGSREAGDEPLMLAAKNPGTITVVAEKRKEGVKFILERFREQPPSVIILDDAFQHRQIARDLDIVVINAGEAYFNAGMLPEGRLREPLANIRRAGLVVLNKITDRKIADAIAIDLKKTGIPIVEARTEAAELAPFGADMCAENTAGMRMLAFAGIGSPEGFLLSLQERGIRVEAHRFFRDHEPYSREKLLPILLEAEKKSLSLVTTEKDYYRLLGEHELMAILSVRPCYYLKIRTEFVKGRETLETLLKAAIHSRNTERGLTP